MKVVIVGGVAGGATAAARLRRLDEKAEIVIYERSGYVSYANCGLPYYVGGVIEDSEDLTLQTPESFRERFNIEVKVRHEVTDIDVKAKTVSVTDLDTGKTFQTNYDKLILSPGAHPVLPPYFRKSERAFTLRTVEDTLKIRAFADKNAPSSAVVIGGGFIGLEMAENLTERGINVTVIQRGGHLLSTVDEDIASFIHAKFRENGVNLLFNTNVAEIADDGQKVVVRSDKGEIVADMLVLAIGVLPESGLAKKAGLKLGAKDAVVVNEKMQTSAPDVYAVGDAVEVEHFVTKEKAVISLAGPANKQGRIAADNICGIESTYKGSQGSSVIKLFDLTVASTGLSEKHARAAKLDYEKIILSPLSHAGYYPGGKIMTMKLLYERKTQKILGAAIAGYEGVDKRIDVLATALRAGLRATDLKDLDLAYAPPYSSAKDPVNMAGFIADNIENGLVKQFYYEDIPALKQRNDVVLLDTRTPREYAFAHAEKFVNIPLDELRLRLGELDKNKKIFVMCQSGLRSYLATRILTQNGFDCYNFAGGYRLYGSLYADKKLAQTAYPCGMEK